MEPGEPSHRISWWRRLKKACKGGGESSVCAGTAVCGTISAMALVASFVVRETAPTQHSLSIGHLRLRPAHGCDLLQFAASSLDDSWPRERTGYADIHTDAGQGSTLSWRFVLDSLAFGLPARRCLPNSPRCHTGRSELPAGTSCPSGAGKQCAGGSLKLATSCKADNGPTITPRTLSTLSTRNRLQLSQGRARSWTGGRAPHGAVLLLLRKPVPRHHGGDGAFAAGAHPHIRAAYLCSGVDAIAEVASLPALQPAHKYGSTRMRIECRPFACAHAFHTRRTGAL